MGFSLGEIGEILNAQRNNSIDCAGGARLIEKKMAEIRKKITDLKSIYRYLDAERANLEASAARQLELQQRSEEHTSELQSLTNLVCRLLLEKKNDRAELPFQHNTGCRPIPDPSTLGASVAARAVRACAREPHRALPPHAITPDTPTPVSPTS